MELARSRILADILWSARTLALDADEIAEETVLHGVLVAAIDRQAELARLVESAPDSSAALARAENDLLLTQNRWDAFQSDMADRYPASEEHTLPLERVQAALPPDGALVGWLDVRLAQPGPTRWAYVIRPVGDVTWIQLRDGRQEIVDDDLWIKPRDLRLAIVPDKPSPLGLGLDDDYRTAAMLLHEQWIAPVLTHLAGVRHLVAVPSASLVGVPLEVFATGDGEDFGAHFTISYAPSATAYAWLTEKAAAMHEYAREGLLVADPPYQAAHVAVADDDEPLLLSSLETTVLRDALAADPAALASLPRLAWSRHEVDGVAGAFPNSDQVIGTDASEMYLRELANDGRLSDYRFLHFATHALVDAKNPQRSALILSQVGEKEGSAEGLLTAAEITREWSLDAELVTLSACETALGREVIGEGVVGFSYPLLQAGAHCLLLSLWQVDDRATALLMQRFYEVWSEGDVGKDEALQEAKGWLREYRGESGTRVYEHPFYWSSFVLIGAAG